MTAVGTQAIDITEDAILARHKNSAPVDVFAAARDLGIKVSTAVLPDNVSGILRRSDSGGSSGYEILVQAAHNLNRQRFTVAHEIGHFVLHRDRATGDIVDDEFYRALSGPLETEANRFAADLLMPWHVMQRLQDGGATRLQDLAKALGVSRQAVAIRLGLPYDTTWE